jgi:hypothetical protein
MTPRLRKLALTAHITASLGWIGADAAFMALAIAGLTSRDSQLVQAAYLAMGVIAWYVIVPMSLASLLTGLLQALGTKWGLFRHYWVLVKFLIGLVATTILLIHTQPISLLAGAAAEAALSSSHLREARVQLVVAAGAGLLVLLVNTVLGVYKPRGLTPYGWRKQHEERAGLARPTSAASRQEVRKGE